MSYLYVAIGDSLTAGVGAGLFSPGFVQRYQRFASIDLKDHVYVQTFAHPGYQSHDILTELDNPLIKEQLTNADIITITAGGNDLIEAARKFQEDNNERDFSVALNNCMGNYCRIMKELIELKNEAVSPYIIRLINLYNPFPNDPLAVKWITRFNAHLKKFTKVPTISIAQIDKVFQGHESEYLSPDGIHPNELGYERIAETLHRLGYGELSEVPDEE